MPTTLLTASLEDAGQRVDVFVAGAQPELSRSQVKRLIREDRVCIAGQSVDPATRVEAGTVVSVEMAPSSTPSLQPEPLAIPLLHVDQDVIVVNKPAGLVVHPGAGNPAQTLVNQLISRFPEIETLGHPLRPGIVHRLDKYTSGVLTVARSNHAYESLVTQFADRTVQKAYLALVEGTPTVARGVIDAPVGRHPTRRTLMSVVRDGKAAITHFALLETLGRFSFLKVLLDTGRTHQIRVHLAAAGLPIAGDAQYGGRAQVPGLQRMFLHAFSLGFTHPSTEEEAHFQAPLADDLVSVLRRCKSKWIEAEELTHASKDPTIGNR
jgi:23S rRNA pseudouridine1911/1915/1917 synthase